MGEKLLAAGSVVTGLGGALGVSYYIYSLENAQPFWGWPGIASAVAVGVGLILLVAGLLGRSRAAGGQVQRGGRGSTNYQAGGDINLGSEDGR